VEDSPHSTEVTVCVVAGATERDLEFFAIEIEREQKFLGKAVIGHCLRIGREHKFEAIQ
jgi:hypothetical protein